LAIDLRNIILEIRQVREIYSLEVSKLSCRLLGLAALAAGADAP
jgi:hypothetical protein